MSRAATVAFLLLAFGALAFRAAVLPRLSRCPDAAAFDSPIRGWAQACLIGAAAALLLWSGLQTRDFAGPENLRGLLHTWPTVLTGTLFGRLLLAQLATVALALALLPRHPGLALLAAAAALLLQAGHGHAWSTQNGVGLLVAAGAVHLLAAGAWLGGLPPLLLAVRRGTPGTGAMAARWFSPLGKWCVTGVVLSAAVQSWVLVGGIAGWVGTAYGWAALAKAALFLVLFALAVLNRYRLAPALLRQAPDRARRALLGALAVQTVAGLGAVALAGTLAQLDPATHEQPFWPFPLRPSLAVMTEPELAGEVWLGAAELAGAALLLALPLLALVWRQARRPVAIGCALLGGVLLGWRAWPHLSLLLVEAYPTSYYASPTGFATPSVLAGAALYPANCAGCHGAEGRGNGPDAARLPIPPAALTAQHLWEHADGELFWWLTAGMPAPDGTPAMPGFAPALSEDDRWALIDYIRAHNAGMAWHDSGAWPAPVQLPSFTVDCPARGTVSTDELRGTVLVVWTKAPSDLFVTPEGAAACRATGPEAWDAMAVVTGRPGEALAGLRVLVDGDGWLRTGEPRPGAWDNRLTLLAAMDAVAVHSLAAPTGGHHHH